MIGTFNFYLITSTRTQFRGPVVFPKDICYSHYTTVALDPHQCFTQLANANKSSCLLSLPLSFVTFIKYMLSSIYEVILGQVYWVGPMLIQYRKWNLANLICIAAVLLLQLKENSRQLSTVQIYREGISSATEISTSKFIMENRLWKLKVIFTTVWTHTVINLSLLLNCW